MPGVNDRPAASVAFWAASGDHPRVRDDRDVGQPVRGLAVSVAESIVFASARFPLS